jgi:hypothetical protein
MASTQTKHEFFSKNVEKGEVDAMSLPLVNLFPNML